MVGGDQPVSFLGIAGVGRTDLIGRNGQLGLPDPAGRFEGADRILEVGIDQPVPGGHRCAVGQEGGIDDHGGPAVVRSHRHVEGAVRSTTQQLGHGRQVVSVRAVIGRFGRTAGSGPYPAGHCQNSSVLATRSQYDEGLWEVPVRPDESEVLLSVNPPAGWTATCGSPGSGDMSGAWDGDTRD